jgi:hypothetical protein
MKIDIQTKIDEYLDLIQAISEHIENPALATAVLQEIRKDMRVEEMRQPRNYVATGDFPASDAQIAYLRKLGASIPEAGLTREHASKLITELQMKKQTVAVEKVPMRRP